MSEKKNRAEKVSITIPPKLKKKAYQAAREQGFESDLSGEVNFSAYLRYTIRKDLEER